jgi:hypothetical protein
MTDKELGLLPIGIQDFPKIREAGYCYVDKTERIHQLVAGPASTYFLSRPRRFGKSLLCSTLGAIFENRRELFGEIAGRPALAINSLDWEWKKYPVIRLDLSGEDYTNGVQALHDLLEDSLKVQAKKLKIRHTKGSPITQFKSLIRNANEKYCEKVVILIDEYDKPLLDTLEYPEIHKQLRSQLKALYGVLKSFDQYLRFVFLTGISKFSQVSIFSDLNNIVDLTFDERYADICGWTEEELFETFKLYIENIVATNKLDKENYIKELRNFYNGYRFTKKDLKVYNPFGMLKHLNSNGEFLSYWYETGTPSFLVKLITQNKIDITKIDKMIMTHRTFQSFDIENMDVCVLLYQTGYLTIVDYEAFTQSFTLEYPNEEVRTSFMFSLSKMYLKSPESGTDTLYINLSNALYNGEIDKAIDVLKVYLAGIPYPITSTLENYFQTVVHIVFSMFGIRIKSEPYSSYGRMDAVVETDKYVYCFEFKVDKSADEALAQIEEKEYLLQFKNTGKQLFKVGVSFDSEKRNIGEWKLGVGISPP